jgi:molybdopterin synthase catalytic subunit
MDLNALLARIRSHPDSHKMGMIASHLGIVRGSSRNGRKVVGIEVECNTEAVDSIVCKIKDMSGIVEVLVEINNGRLRVGDEILSIAVGGDIRENVFPALIKAVDLIKSEASSKREIFED